MQRFIGTIAVVTGASSGIGRTIAQELVKRGMNVAGLARRTNKLQELKNEISNDSSLYKGNFQPIECDISSERNVKEAFQLIKRMGPIGVLVNNAGALYQSTILESEANGFDNVFSTNVKGTILCSKEAIQSMDENSIDGHIININSITSLRFSTKLVTKTRGTIYSASKTAERVLSEAIRRELLIKKKQIKITDLYPGLVLTEMVEHSVRKDKPNEFLNVEEITSACIFLLDTPPRMLISEMVIKGVHDPY